MKTITNGIYLLMLGFGIVNSTHASEQKLVWFGKQEVQSGELKSSDGQLPSAGEQVILRVFKAELATKVYDGSMTYQGGYGAQAMTAKLFVRFASNQNWHSIELQKGYYETRGPMVTWDKQEDVILDIPFDAKKIEVYIEFQRGRPGDCYLAYDMTECSSLYPWSPGYISNFGKNFELALAK